MVGGAQACCAFGRCGPPAANRASRPRQRGRPPGVLGCAQIALRAGHHGDRTTWRWAVNVRVERRDGGHRLAGDWAASNPRIRSPPSSPPGRSPKLPSRSPDIPAPRCLRRQSSCGRSGTRPPGQPMGRKPGDVSTRNDWRSQAVNALNSVKTTRHVTMGPYRGPKGRFRCDSTKPVCSG